MTITELVPNLVVQEGRETLKVSTVYGPDRVTAQVVLPVPARTTVRSYSAEQVALWRPVSDTKFAQYASAWRAVS
jgi:hypothetical protein